jgi:hypothetical protein
VIPDDVHREIRRRIADSSVLQQAQAYESSRVTFLLKQTGRGPLEPALRRQHVDQFGSPALTFAGFAERFPEFPVLLGAAWRPGVPLHEDPKATLPVWFRDFPKLPFMPAFYELVARTRASARGRAAGLIFPRKGFDQGLVVHTPVPGADFGVGAHFAYAGREGDREYRVEVRPFRALVAAALALPGGWRAGPAD